MVGYARRNRRGLAVAGSLGVVLALVVLFGPPRLFEYSESPGFCAACHVMKEHYESWTHMGSHRSKRCIDCHLPNRHWAPHLLWKGIDGAKDVLSFFSGLVPDPIVLSARGRRTAQDNCVRCHEGMVSRIDGSRPCSNCHRRATHKGAGLIDTR
ncbi:MAG: NapC/NirT family cytochrome c [Elusimicrobia bacterium]|nr:NapC/NirT family cytochrome c [Elusimicrobiota bacterium]